MTDPPRIDRRTLLAGGALAALGALAGCGGHRQPASSSAPTTARSVSPPPTTALKAAASSTTAEAPARTVEPAGPLDPAAWKALARSLRGRLVLPATPGYATDKQLFDWSYDTVRPAVIAYCADAEDVARCLAFARDHRLVPTPRAGGHSYAGYSTGPGLVVDVTAMATVTPPAAGSSRATIGAGARLIDVYSGLNAAGWSIPAGSCPTVGISGLALGGGIGVVARAQGLTLDHVTSLQVVTADSRVVTADATQNPDLYWACRGGGGGNFGVVTSFEVDTFATQPVTLFSLTWPWSAATTLLPAWMHWMSSAPDALWSTCLAEAQPGEPAPRLQMSGVYLGDTTGATNLLASLRAEAGTPASSTVYGSPFSSAMYIEAGCFGLSEAACHLPTQNPAGQLSRAPSVAKSDLLTSPLAEAGVHLVGNAVAARQAAGLPGAVAYDSLGGAASRVPAAATAWVHRDALFSVQYSVPLAAGQPASQVSADWAWLDSLYAALRPYVSGQAYQNYIDPHLVGWKQAYYGANLPRLEAIKGKWDPDAVFRFAQSIPPAG